MRDTKTKVQNWAFAIALVIGAGFLSCWTQSKMEREREAWETNKYSVETMGMTLIVKKIDQQSGGVLKCVDAETGEGLTISGTFILKAIQ